MSLGFHAISEAPISALSSSDVIVAAEVSDLTGSLPAPSVQEVLETPGSLDLAGSTVAPDFVGQLSDVTISAGVQGITGSTPALAGVGGDVTILWPGARSGTLSIPAPEVVTDSGFGVSEISGTLSIQAPTVTPVAKISPSSSQDGALSIPAPGVLFDFSIPSAPPLEGAASLPAPAGVGGGVTTTPGSMDGTVSIPAPAAVEANVAIPAGVLAAIGSIPAAVQSGDGLVQIGSELSLAATNPSLALVKGAAQVAVAAALAGLGSVPTLAGLSGNGLVQLGAPLGTGLASIPAASPSGAAVVSGLSTLEGNASTPATTNGQGAGVVPTILGLIGSIPGITGVSTESVLGASDALTLSGNTPTPRSAARERLSSLEKALWDILTTDPNVQASISDRLYPHLAPTSAALPYAVVSRATTPRNWHTRGAAGVSLARFRIAVYASTSPEADLAARRIEATLRDLADHPGTFDSGNVVILDVQPTDRNDFYISSPNGSEPGKFGTSITVEIWHEETVPVFVA